MEWLLEIAKEYGLFVALVVYTLWDSRNREIRYIAIIDKLTKNYEIMRKDIAFIKVYMRDKDTTKKDDDV